MIRKRTKAIEIYRGNYQPYHGEMIHPLQGRWVDSEGAEHSGALDLFNIIGPGMGMVLKGGETIEVTVEVTGTWQHNTNCTCMACTCEKARKEKK